jgi:hypothetical protein
VAQCGHSTYRSGRLYKGVSTSQGEQNINLLSVGCEQDAALCPLKVFSSSPSAHVPLPLDTLACDIAHGESTASEWRAVDPRPERLNLPDSVEEPLEEAGGVWSAPQILSACVAVNINAETTAADMPHEWCGSAGLVLHESCGRVAANPNAGANEYVAVVPHAPGGARPGLACVGAKSSEVVKRATENTHKRGGARLATNAAPVPTKGSTGIKPTSVAVRAAAARPEALKARAEKKDGRTGKEPS